MKVVRIFAASTLAFAILELCTRAVARRSIVEWLSHYRPEPGEMAFVAIAAAALGLYAARDADHRRTRVSLIFGVLFAAGVAAQIHLGARLQSDGFYYFSYLRSIAFDRDVEFSNDYRMLGLGDKPHLFEPTPTGYAQSAWTIGPAIVWAPFFAAAHPVAAWLSAGGADVNTIGTSYPYRQAVCIAGLFYGLLGCWFATRLTAVFFDRRTAAGAVALTICGSFMLWYLVKEPSMTHAPSMAGVAGFAWFWAATRGRRSLAQWALLGALGGFITLIRWQNALFAILPAYDAATLLLAALKHKDRPAINATLLAGAAFTLCATLAFTPQMLAWKSIYGSFLAVSPVGPQIRWWDPHIVDILWSSRNGLFSWSPVLYIGALGLLIFAWTYRHVGIPMLAAVAAMVYFNASIQDWWGSDGFGGRRFDGTLPLFAVGLAAVLQIAAGIVRRHPLRTVGAFGVILVALNLAMMSAAQDGLFRIGQPLSFGDAGAHQARALHRWIGNPFTYPASLWFAARNDVPIAAYDLLDANRFLGDPARQYGRVDIGLADEILITTGWHPSERDGDVTFRWASGAAAVLIPLDHAADLQVQLRLRAFNFPGAPPQHVTVLVNGQPAGQLEVPPEWTTLLLDADRGAWRAGVNELRLQFDRETRPADVGLGGDGRSLAAAVDYVRIQVRD